MGSIIGLEPLTDPKEDRYEGLYVIGHPLGISAQLTSELFKINRVQSRELIELIPPGEEELLNQLQDRNSPATDIEVLSIEGSLVKGHSGAPVLNKYDQVIGIVNGGLQALGGDEIGWVIPWEATVTSWQLANEENVRGDLMNLHRPKHN